MGFETRFEQIIYDPNWGRVAQSIAFDNIMDHCQIEKAFYKEARCGRFEGVREWELAHGLHFQ